MFGQVFKRTARREVRRQARRRGNRFITYLIITVVIPAVMLAATNFMDDVTFPNWIPWQGNLTFQQVTVTRIIDGDTIDVNINGEIERIRFIGVDAPEMGFYGGIYEQGATEATEFVRQQIEEVDNIIYLQSDGNDRDRWGRLRRYVWLADPTLNEVRNNPDQYLLNDILVNEGHAVIWE